MIFTGNAEVQTISFGVFVGKFLNEIVINSTSFESSQNPIFYPDGPVTCFCTPTPFSPP